MERYTRISKVSMNHAVFDALFFVEYFITSGKRLIQMTRTNPMHKYKVVAHLNEI